MSHSGGSEWRRDDDCIALGDHVMITGGGLRRMVAVKAGSTLRLGNLGAARLDKLAGLRFGEVVQYSPRDRMFVPSNAYPDLDILNVRHGEDETRDNRHLVDNNTSQNLSSTEIAVLRQEKGVDQLLASLVEKSATFQTKTTYSQDKYLRRKKKRHGTLYKVERVTPDGLAELYLHTICPSCMEPEESRWIRLRADTLALILHHSDVHSGSRALVYDNTNGQLEAALLSRLGGDGVVLQLMNKKTQPNVLPARAMGLKRIQELWKLIPRNKEFLLGIEAPEEEEGESGEEKTTARSDKTHKNKKRKVEETGDTPQWIRGIDAHRALKERPADLLIVADDDDTENVIAELLPFLAIGAHIVVYSPFLEDLTRLFPKFWSDCVNVCVSETWYRHHQVLPNRTHPTVNMNTAGGYLLTAVKAGATSSPQTCLEKLELCSAATAKVTEVEEEERGEVVEGAEAP